MYKLLKYFSTLLLIFFSSFCPAQKSAVISGKVVDENDKPLSQVNITVLGYQNGVLTSDSGTFKIRVAADKAFALTFSFSGYRTKQKNLYLKNGEEKSMNIILQRDEKILENITITDNRERKESGLIKIDPKNALILPSTTGGVEGLIKILVGSNNELTSQYNVRGGNYDENLIYINDIEIFRPYLVRSGQQEGLSFINPELTRNINFFNGAFQAKYGDKISSVLDVQYKKPKAFGGSLSSSQRSRRFGTT